MFCNSFAEKWTEVDSIEDDLEKMKRIKEVLAELPPENCKNIAFLFSLLAKVVEEDFHNKMTVDNIIVVVSPNLLWAEGGSQVPINTVFSLMIERFDWIFADKNIINPLNSNLNISQSSLASVDSYITCPDTMNSSLILDSPMTSRFESIGEKDELDEDNDDEEKLQRRGSVTRKAIKNRKVNRVFAISTDLSALSTTDDDLDEENKLGFRHRSKTIETSLDRSDRQRSLRRTLKQVDDDDDKPSQRQRHNKGHRSTLIPVNNDLTLAIGECQELLDKMSSRKSDIQEEDNDDDDKAEEEDPDEDDVDGDKRESHRLRGKTVDATRDKSDRQKKLLSERQSTLKAEDHPHLVHDPLFSTHD